MRITLLLFVAFALTAGAATDAVVRMTIPEVLVAFDRTQTLKLPMPAKVFWKEARLPADDGKLFLSFSGEKELRWMRYQLTSEDPRGRAYTLTIFFTAKGARYEEWTIYRAIFAEESMWEGSDEPVRILAPRGFFFHEFDLWKHDIKKVPNKAPEPTSTAVTPPAAQESRRP